jgi:hypothetical protein
MEKMKRASHYVLVVLIAGVVFFRVVSLALGFEDVSKMDKDELKALLDKPDVVIFDARTSSDWDKSDIKIKGAHRLDQNDVESVKTMYPKERTIVVYCA